MSDKSVVAIMNVGLLVTMFALIWFKEISPAWLILCPGIIRFTNSP